MVWPSLTNHFWKEANLLSTKCKYHNTIFGPWDWGGDSRFEAIFLWTYLCSDTLSMLAISLASCRSSLDDLWELEESADVILDFWLVRVVAVCREMLPPSCELSSLLYWLSSSEVRWWEECMEWKETMLCFPLTWWRLLFSLLKEWEDLADFGISKNNWCLTAANFSHFVLNH